MEDRVDGRELSDRNEEEGSDAQLDDLALARAQATEPKPEREEPTYED